MRLFRCWHEECPLRCCYQSKLHCQVDSSFFLHSFSTLNKIESTTFIASCFVQGGRIPFTCNNYDTPSVAEKSTSLLHSRFASMRYAFKVLASPIHHHHMPPPHSLRLFFVATSLPIPSDIIRHNQSIHLLIVVLRAHTNPRSQGPKTSMETQPSYTAIPFLATTSSPPPRGLVHIPH